MIQFFIYDKQIGIKKALLQCGNIDKLKELIKKAKQNASPETTTRINGANLTICR